MNLLFLFKIFNQLNALLHAPVQPLVLQALRLVLLFSDIFVITPKSGGHVKRRLRLAVNGERR